MNATALQTAAQTSIANTQTQGAVQLGLAQSSNQVAIASIAAGGIAPYSVAGTPGYNAAQTNGGSPESFSAVVGNAQVQSQQAQSGVAEAQMIQNVGNATTSIATNGAGGPVNQGLVQPVPVSPFSAPGAQPNSYVSSGLAVDGLPAGDVYENVYNGTVYPNGYGPNGPLSGAIDNTPAAQLAAAQYIPPTAANVAAAQSNEIHVGVTG